MSRNCPNPNVIHPLKNFDRVCFIKNTVKNPNIQIGDFTYYDDPENATNFEKNVLYHYDFVGDKLIIGKFCAIATSVKFIMNGANHRIDTFSSFPFSIFGPPWSEQLQGVAVGAPSKGDTIVGNDVWIGYDSTIMPGVTIGNGAIIAAKSVVIGNVPPFSIFGGNPAKLIRLRFDEDTIKALQEIQWWNWDHSAITQHLRAIVSADIQSLNEAYQNIEMKKRD